MDNIVSVWNNDTIEKIKSYKKIYIYGAGEWGRRFYIWCDRSEIRIHAVVVTSMAENPDKLFNCEVKAIDSMEEEIGEENSLTIVAVRGSAGRKLYTQLNEKIRNVWLITQLPLLVEDDNYYAILDREEFAYALSRWFYQDGHYLDLENPVTFNEKIQWLKVYGDQKLMSRLADKYLVREWVRKQIGDKYLVKLLGKWEHFDEINFDELPNRFVLKCNHGCGYNIIVKDKRLFDISDAKKKIDQWMSEDFGIKGAFEHHYSLIDRKIIAEEYIEQIDGGLYDYKVHCFNGEPHFVEVIGERGLEQHEGRECVFNTKWEKQDWLSGVYPCFTHDVPMPQCLAELLDVARKLSQGTSYVRVDLYILEDGIKVGEMTFTPGGGAYPYNDGWTREANIVLGNLLHLPNENLILKEKMV